MTTKTIETLTWVLIYGGLLLLSLGAFVAERSAPLGTTLGVAGVGAAVAGAVLIWVRSRMKTDTATAKDRP